MFLRFFEFFSISICFFLFFLSLLLFYYYSNYNDIVIFTIIITIIIIIYILFYVVFPDLLLSLLWELKLFLVVSRCFSFMVFVLFFWDGFGSCPVFLLVFLICTGCFPILFTHGGSKST